MIGNYPVNDDWVFVRQIEAFNQGILKLNAELDPSFLSQGFLGFIWSKFFGSGFVSLQILTILITLLGLWGFIKILKHFKLNKKLIVVSSLLYIFNPLVFTSAFSFMTDNYLLTFMILAIYFFLKYEKTSLYTDIIFASAFTLVAALVRQVGVFVGLAFVAGFLFEKYILKKSKAEKIRWLTGFTVLLAVFLGFYIPHIWPDYGSNRMFILPEQVLGRINLWLLSWHYIPLFMFPLFLGLRVKINTVRKQLVFLATASIFTIFLYNYNIFPVGNVLYLEGLHAKSDFRINFSLFDNIFFKLWFCVTVAFALAKGAFFLAELVRKAKLKWEKQDMFLLSLGLMNCFVLLVSSDFYDRYLLPSFVCFFLLFLKKFSKNIFVSKRVIFTTSVLIFISFALQWEFSAKSRIKWQQVRALSEKTGYVRQIQLNDTYIDYIVTQKENDFTGLIERKGAYDKECYVQEYTLDTDCKLLEITQKLEDFVDKRLIERKKPYNVHKKSIPRAKNNLNLLVYNQRYPSFLYDLVGKEAYVGSWCLEKQP